MAYSLNPLDPFADEEEAALIVPPDRDDHVDGTPVVFVGVDHHNRQNWKERRCSTCGRVMVIPEGAPLDSERLLVMCPRRHESETITAPDGYERVTDTDFLFDLLRVRESEAWA